MRCSIAADHHPDIKVKHRKAQAFPRFVETDASTSSPTARDPIDALANIRSSPEATKLVYRVRINRVPPST